MKWLIGVLAALMYTTAQAQQIDLAFQAKPNECRWYKDNFGPSGAGPAQTDTLPKIACRLVNGEGVTCLMKEHGLEKKWPDVMKFKGNFRDDGEAVSLGPDGDAMRSTTGPFAFQIKCTQGVGCYMRFWNTQENIGYSCNLMSWNGGEKKSSPPPAQKQAPVKTDGTTL